MDYSRRHLDRFGMVAPRIDLLHNHHRHPFGTSVLQDGKPHVDAFRQDHHIRRWCSIGSRQCLLGDSGRHPDVDHLPYIRRAMLHHHHRHSLWPPKFQDGQTRISPLRCDGRITGPIHTKSRRPFSEKHPAPPHLNLFDIEWRTITIISM